ncbi:MAG TPA: hypothetical protein VFB92_20895 [Vicinamibacterales bacterium]|jgi:hypothetical protein|nr:hypothetical protein [Vicinamibacterales bacterium]
MSGRDIQSLLAQRRVTRAISEAVRAELSQHVSVLTPLLRPDAVFSEYIEGGRRDAGHRPGLALKELQALYEQIAPAKPLNLRRELTPPFPFANATLEMTPVDYVHVARSGDHERKITVRRPLTWTLSYVGFAPAKLQALIDSKGRSPEEMQRFILAYLLLHFVIKHQPGLTHILDELHFRATSLTVPEFGELPVTRIGIDVTTERPEDDVVIESAELTGMDAFEEVVNADDISRLQSAFPQRLIEIVARHGSAAATS